MRPRIFLLLVACAAAPFAACAGDVRPRVAAAVNAAEPHLVNAYEVEGHACVDSAKSRADGASCIAKVDAKWARVWAALDAARVANDAVSAWCALRASVGALGSGDLVLAPVDGVACPP